MFLWFYTVINLDGKQQPECHTITILDQCKLLCNVIWIHSQMTARSANGKLFKQFKRFLPCFQMVIDICMKTNPTHDNWEIVARVLSFKMVWIGAHSHPLKRPIAQKTAPASTLKAGFTSYVSNVSLILHCDKSVLTLRYQNDFTWCCVHWCWHCQRWLMCDHFLVRASKCQFFLSWSLRLVFKIVAVLLKMCVE